MELKVKSQGEQRYRVAIECSVFNLETGELVGDKIVGPLEYYTKEALEELVKLIAINNRNSKEKAERGLFKNYTVQKVITINQ